MGRQGLSPFTTVGVSWLTAEPGLLLRAVADTCIPDQRAELGTDPALRRVAG